MPVLPHGHVRVHKGDLKSNKENSTKHTVHTVRQVQARHCTALLYMLGWQYNHWGCSTIFATLHYVASSFGSGYYYSPNVTSTDEQYSKLVVAVMSVHHISYGVLAYLSQYKTGCLYLWQVY